ncbi:putative RNA helicase [Helianthus annuus]|nr:putative RNA helicase [Helianthus annuus]
MATSTRILTLSLSSSTTTTTTTRFSVSLITSLKFHPPHRLYQPFTPLRVYQHFRPLTTTTAVTEEPSLESSKHSILLERLRIRHLKDYSAAGNNSNIIKKQQLEGEGGEIENKKKVVLGFNELGLSEEVLGALGEMGITVPTEIQCLGIPQVLDGKSVVLGSHTGSGKTLAYLLPLVQLLRQDEALNGMVMKPRRPRAVILCPTRELCEQVFGVAKSISHHARFRSTMVSGGGRLRPQEDALNSPIDMVVGTPGRVLQHIQEGNLVYGDIKYLVLDEADTMFDRGFGPDIRKFLGPLKNRAQKADGLDFQTVLVSATMTNAVQKLVDEEFQGIEHLRTSTLHKKVASARHDFIKLSGSENKLEALLQVLEPSLAKGNRVMVFCNTLNSSRAVDHFLSENQLATVNYHGEVPAVERVENLKKFKSNDGDCPTLVCTDLAARGLDLDVDHVIMFDFPLNSIDYLHRTGRTARMGAKGKVTSLITKKDLTLANRVEEAMRKNESLESLTVNNFQGDGGRPKLQDHKAKGKLPVKVKVKVSDQKNNKSLSAAKSSTKRSTSGPKSSKVVAFSKSPTKRSSSGPKSDKAVDFSKVKKRTSKVSTKPLAKTGGSTRTVSQKTAVVKSPLKLNVVGFRGRSSASGSVRAS